MNGNDAIEMSEQAAYEDAFLAIGRDGHLEGAAYGIFRQLDESETDLSDRQREVLHDVVDQFMLSNGCDLCGDCELDDLESILETGYCSSHADLIGKDD